MIDKNLQFIINKIVDIKVALFHCQTKSVLKMPSSIITTYKVDDDGTILFFMPRPKQLISQFEKEFPVGLNYFRKGLNYYMNIYGIARIVNDPEELHEYDFTAEEVERALHKDVLVNVKILKADYYQKDRSGANALKKLKTFIYGLMSLAPGEKTYDFSTKGQVHNYGF
jgi:hypothetical protein